MPLRSVEAATRDDAIAAAREQFGPTARVVGVRRVRSGGVLGFFATERYVAEVADPAGRPVVAAPAPSQAPEAPSDESPSDYSSPLASAAPARARAAAPPRNGAAAWAAEAARSSLDQPAAPPHSSPAMARVPAAVPAEVRPAARTTTPARSGSHPAAGRTDDERLSELAALLAAPPAAPEAPAPTRASFPRAEFQRSPNPRPRDDGPRLPQEHGQGAGAAADAAPAAPSPFTAALARMVAGDRDVRQAVREALDDPAVPRSRSDEGSWPSRHETFGPEDTSVASRTTRQKEETVGDQVIAPSTSVDQPVDVPAWATESGVLAPAASSREQAIAEVLRAALALGHSDEALTGILRKVLAGVAPQTALAEPELSVPVRAVPEVAVPPVAVPVVLPAPVVDPFPTPEPATPVLFGRPAADEVAPETTRVEPASAPIAAAPLFPVAAPVPAAPLPAAPLPAAPLRTEPAPLFAAPASSGAPAPSCAAPARFALPPLFAPSPGSMWGDPSPPPLWGDPVTVAVSRVRQPEAAIWAEAAVGDDADADIATPAEVEVPAEVDPDGSSSEEPAPMRDVVLDVYPEEPFVSDEPSAVPSPELDAHDVAVEEVDVAAVETEAAVDVDVAVDASVAELAPALAPTASDPAPFMSLDSTTVMPPLSLLPPLPSSRGRGRPPVPPASRPLSRHAPSTGLSPTAPAPSETAEGGTETEVPVTAPATAAPPARSWATVTRLPVAPRTATPVTPEMPEMPEMPELGTDQAEEGADAFLADPASQLPGAGDVRGRLEALGLPADLLGDSFDDDVTGQGTYAALTSALARRLPVAPELPAGAGEVLFVVGPGVETLRSARSLAATLHLDRDAVQWATRGELAGLAPKGSRMTTVETAIERQRDAATSGSVTIVAVDAPLRTDTYWMSQMLAIWAPTAVWVVVEATRKPEDLEPWIDGLPRVDALVVTDADLSADPAAVLRRMTAPVAILDGVRATPHRWASLLCERLEQAKS